MTFSRTIRLFVSSTFRDLKAERDALQCEVFPRLKQLCLSKGLRFQAIDLRWGISEEAGRDNKTMRICLRELCRCQQDRPKPNFLILLGDRYGWRPLPEIIPAALFEKLAAALQATHPNAAQLLQKWYLLDKNAVPPVAELQPRGDDASWPEQVETPLLGALEQAAQTLGLDLEKEGVTIGASATEQEIIEGALKIPDAATHVRAFFRTIDDLPNNPPLKDYVDLGSDGHRDTLAAERLAALKDRIHHHIGDRSVCRYRVPWRGDGISADDLKEFCIQAWKQLSEVVTQQIDALKAVPSELLEEQAHQDFGKERCRRFVGRGESLKRIAVYLRQGSDKPLAVIGPSGSGKSAVMAKAVQAAGQENSKAQIIARYIGITPESSDFIQMLRNLVAEIRRRYPVPVAKDAGSGEDGKAKPGDAEIPFECDPLIDAFHEALQRPTADQPLWIFLDALDQLTASHQAYALAWLPGKLSEHVRLVVSAALPKATVAGVAEPESTASSDRNSTDPRPAIIAALTSRLETAQRVMLAPLSIANGEQMLTNWLDDVHRTLQEPQRRTIIKTFQVEGSPLWLHTATNEAMHLASWQPAPSFAPTTPELLGQVLDRLSKGEEHGEKLVSHTLSYLACARHGLAEDEILDILSADKEVMADFRRRSPDSPKTDCLPVSVWVRLHGDLAFYLAEHQAQGVSLLGFYHRSFLEVVIASCLAASEIRLTRYGTLATYFGAQPLLFHRAAGISYNLRKLYELPYQRTMAATWDALEAVLTDIDFIEAKSRAGMLFDLTSDYICAESVWPGQEEERQKERKREQRVKKYVDALIAYSLAHTTQREGRDVKIPPLPEPPPSVTWTSKPEVTDAGREWTPLERVKIWSQFVGTHIWQLANGKESVFQIAWNSAASGPIAERVAEIERAGNGPTGEWLGLRNRPTFTPKPACLKVLAGHTGIVNAVSITADGGRVVSGSADSTVRVWDLATGECLKSLEGHTEPVHAVSITLDGQRAVSGSFDTTLRVWELASGKCLKELVGHTDYVNAVSITPDGGRAISGGGGQRKDNTLRVWDLATGECLHVLAGHTGEVHAVSIAPDGRRAASGSRDETLRVWDLATGECLRVLAGHTGEVYAVSITPYGRRAVSGSFDHTLRVWDLETGECLNVLKGHTSGILAVSVTADGGWAISGSYDRTLRVWDLATGECLKTLEGHTYYVQAVSITPDSRWAVSGSWDKTIRVWDLVNSECLHVLDVHTRDVHAVSITPDGRRAVSGSADNTLRVWDLAIGRCLQVLEGHTSGVNAVSITPDGRQAVSGSNDSTLRVWDLATGECLKVLEGHTNGVNAVSITPDGRQAVSGSGEYKTSEDIRVWNLVTGKCLHVMKGHARPIAGVFITPDGERAVSMGHDFTPRAWDLATGKCLHVLEGHTSYVYAVSITPDGKRVVSGSADNTIRMWDLATGKCLHVLEGHTKRIDALSITPDGRRADSGEGVFTSGTLRVWDLATGKCLHVLEGHRGPIQTLSITSDGRRAVSGSYDRTLRVWDLATGDCIMVCATESAVTCLAVYSTSLVVGEESGRVDIVTIENGCMDRPIITAVRLKLLEQKSWDTYLTALCDACGRRFQIPVAILDTIAAITRNVHLDPDDSPSLKLPAEASDEPRLLSECPLCHQPIKFNPFVVDNRPRSKGDVH